MKKTKLSTSVLLALGVVGCKATPCLDVAACLTLVPTGDSGDSGDTGVGPCLDVAPTGDTGVGPCLDVAPTGDTGVGPCLSPPIESAETADTGPTEPPTETADTAQPPQNARASVIDALIDTGALSQDVLDRLRKR